jgi:predicted lipoprotein with Yx(FWY)xxD motif
LGKLLAVPALLLAAISLAGCGASGIAAGDSGAAGRGEPVTLSAEEIPGLGEVVVDEGVTLYVFAPDRRRAVTCTGECAAAWPPLTVPGGQRPQADGAVRRHLVGTKPDPAGGRVVTYAGWPLYRFVSDTEPGEANGQDVNLNGGYWYVISPNGELIR